MINQRLCAVFFAGVLAVTVLSSTGNAALWLYEPFDYSGTDIAAGSSGVWTDSVSLTSPKINQALGTVGPITLSGDGTSLDYPGLGVSTGARVADSGGGTASRSLGTGLGMNLASDNTYYVSMLIRGSGILEFYYGPHSDSTYYVRTFLGITDDTGEFFVGSYPESTSGGTREVYSDTYSNGTYDPNETYLLVAKIDGNTSSNDVFSLKIYDSTMTPDLVEPASFDLVASNGSGVNMTYMLIGMYDDGEIDEIRVGTEWSDVISNVPEPSTAVLLIGVLAPLAIAVSRFRRGRYETQLY